MLPLQIAWCWLKGSLVRATKRLILHFSCCSFSCQQLLPLHGAEIQTLCGKGWEPSPGLSNILGGVKSIYINTRFPEAWVGTPNNPQALLEQSLLTVGISCGTGNYTHLSNFLCNFKQPAQFGVLELVLFLKSSNNFQDKQKYLSSPKHSDFTDVVLLNCISSTTASEPGGNSLIRCHHSYPAQLELSVTLQLSAAELTPSKPCWAIPRSPQECRDMVIVFKLDETETPKVRGFWSSYNKSWSCWFEALPCFSHGSPLSCSKYYNDEDLPQSERHFKLQNSSMCFLQFFFGLMTLLWFQCLENILASK